MAAAVEKLMVLRDISNLHNGYNYRYCEIFWLYHKPGVISKNFDQLGLENLTARLLNWISMIEIGQAEFENFIDDGIAALPPLYQKRIDNVAFLVGDYPTPDQRVRLNLYPNETLFGLYEGVPLPRRNGTLKLLPDKITIFKKPIEAASRTADEVKELVRHTIWHEVAHYYGLDHQRIHELDGKADNK